MFEQAPVFLQEAYPCCFTPINAVQLLHGPCRNQGAGWVRGITPKCKLLFLGGYPKPQANRYSYM